jgi:isocitrate dehydrogenase
LLHRATIDNNEFLKTFVHDLESSVIQTVENGFMTKDLALIVNGTSELKRNQYCETIEFIKKVRETYERNILKARL